LVYGVTWNLNRKDLFNWKDEEAGNFEKKVKHFFDCERILKVIHDYIIFFKKDDELHKVILRQHQTRAIEKIMYRALEREKRRALIWHTQGSGKTLTMITIAQELFLRPEFEKPLIILLVDRNMKNTAAGPITATRTPPNAGLSLDRYLVLHHSMLLHF
jgi:type I restriction enzyme, R subunit